MTTETRNAREVTVSKSSVMEQAAVAADTAVTPDSEVEELEAAILAQLEAALDEASAQVAGPTNWWDLLAIGPFTSPVTAGFPKPNPIVRVGQTLRIVSVLFLNPIMPVGPAHPSPLDIYGPLHLNYRLNWDTTNVSNCVHVPALSGVRLSPLLNSPFSIQTITMTPTTAGLCELNLRGQILTAINSTYPPFAAYASRVVSINSSLFGPNGLTIASEQPIRFDVYA